MLPLSKCPPPYLAPKFLHRYFPRVNAPVSSVFWACFLMSFGLALHWLCLYMGRYYSLVCWRSPSLLCTHWNSSLRSIVPCHHCKMQVASMPLGLVSTQVQLISMVQVQQSFFFYFYETLCNLCNGYIK